MRKILISSLFFSTVLLHAQTATKAQGVVLEARNASAPAAAAADGDTNPQPRISTGVVWPRLISEPSLSVSSTDFFISDVTTQHLVVGFRVDANGNPQNVHVVQSVSPKVDEQVMASIRKARYVPGRLDDQAVPVDVNLIVNFQEKW